MDEIRNMVSQAKGYAHQAIDFAKNIPNKIAELGPVKEFMAHPLRYGCIAAGVIVLLLLIIIMIRISGRRPRLSYSGGVVGAGGNVYVDKRAQRRAERREDRYYRELIRQKRREDYYKPRKRRVLYVKTMAPKVKKKVEVRHVYTTNDQATMMATGIVGMGIGAMTYSALMNNKKKY